MTLRTITVAELIELLEGESPNARVIVSADYDKQALPLRGELDTVTIAKCAYSNSGFAIVELDEDDDEASDETFLVLR